MICPLGMLASAVRAETPCKLAASPTIHQVLVHKVVND